MHRNDMYISESDFDWKTLMNSAPEKGCNAKISQIEKWIELSPHIGEDDIAYDRDNGMLWVVNKRFGIGLLTRGKIYSIYIIRMRI